MRPFRALLRPVRGLATLDYAIIMAILVAISIGFVGASSGVLRRGLDTTQQDFSRPDSLDSVVGPVEVVVESALDLLPGAPPSAITGQPYAFSFDSFLRGRDRTDLAWSLQASGPLPPGFSFNTATGTLTGTFGGGPMVQRTLHITATTASEQTSEVYVWTARDAGLFLRPAALPPVVPNTPYTVSFGEFLERPDSIAPDSVQWSVSNSTLPAGLAVAGTPPSVSGTYTGPIPARGAVTITATAGPYTATQSYTVGTTGLVLLPYTGPGLVSGTPMDLDFATLLDRDPSVPLDKVVWSVGFVDGEGQALPAPAGLAVDGTRIAGTPKAAASTTLLVRVSAAYGPWSAERVYSLSLAGQGVVLMGGALPDGEPYVFATVELATRAQVAPDVQMSQVQWSVVEGALPPGFALDAATGTLSGRLKRAAGGQYGFAIQANVPGRGMDTAHFTWVFAATSVNESPVLPTAYYGVPFQASLPQFLMGGNAQGLVWSVSGLPEGLSLDPATGLVSGTSLALKDALGVQGAGAPLSLVVQARDASRDRTIDWTVDLRVDGLEPFRVAYAGDFACGLDERGWVACWGRGLPSGILGRSDRLSGSHALPMYMTNQGRPFTDIESNRLTACGLDREGNIWCWGNNQYGHFGNGTTQAATVSNFNPVPVDMSQIGSGVVQISVGDQHSCAISAAGEAWCWGRPGAGRLGNGSTTVGSLVPLKVLPGAGMTAPLVRIVAGLNSSCALDVNGDAWCWGNGASGKLGTGTTNTRTTPFRVVATEMGKVVDLTLGTDHGCAVSLVGRVWCWGTSASNLMGGNETANQLIPIEVMAGNMTGVERVVASELHTCAYRGPSSPLGPKAWCWGDEGHGRLGNGVVAAEYNTSFAGPSVVVDTEIPEGFAAIETGITQTPGTCGWTNTRKIYCWGRGQYNRLGKVGVTTDSGVPVLVDFPAITPP